jgi:hypothetical protein
LSPAKECDAKNAMRARHAPYLFMRFPECSDSDKEIISGSYRVSKAAA